MKTDKPRERLPLTIRLLKRLAVFAVAWFVISLAFHVAKHFLGPLHYDLASETTIARWIGGADMLLILWFVGLLHPSQQHDQGTPPMTDVEEIARGLSEAQRELLLLLPAGGEWAESQSVLHRLHMRHGPNALCGFGKSGLIEGYYHDPMRHRLTPLGLAVRAHLEQEQTK